MKPRFRASGIRTMSAFVAVILAIPLSLGIFTGLYNWFSPFISLNSIFVLKTFVWLNFLSFFILILALFRKNWFCRYMCPVGWGCDLVSAYAHRKASGHKSLPDISKWLVLVSFASAILGLPLLILLDPMAVFHGFFTLFAGKLTLVKILSLSGLPLLLSVHLLFPGLWCGKICPLGGLQKILWETRMMAIRLFRKNTGEPSGNNSGRRYFLASGIGLMAGIAIPKLFKKEDSVFLRPPAATEPEIFNTLCIRCGSCIKVCPTHIISNHSGNGNLFAWMTPEIRFEKGYCLETCNLCSRVCPSGAITLFSVKAKSQIFMGTAVIHLDDCLLTKNTECDRCKVSCKFKALEIVQGKQAIQMVPEIITDKCVGCGACAVICPVNTIEIIPFTGFPAR